MVSQKDALTPYLRRGIYAVFYSNGNVAKPLPAGDTIPSDVEQATGLEKKELDALLSGVEDPFNLGINKGPWGTKDKPKLVPSFFEERLVGCVCEEDATYINWMKLQKGPAQRCECGHWFQLVEGSSNKV